ADVQTVGYSIEPQYAYPRNAAPRITGYVSRNIVAIRLENLNAVTTLIDATVAEGANELHGIQFTFKDDEASRDAARAQAMQTARRRADAYAEAAGMRVARVDSVTEAGAPVPAYDSRYDGYSMRAMNESSAQAAPASPIAAGELDSYASVTVVFELR
ncbi:MAG TPA: SIMPL domain-containing protein, partial [Terricaulis sp.]|nr:SIMPL domain-containing protein [Terricaulis sp.]